MSSSSLRASAIRQVFRHQSLFSPRIGQRRWAQVQDVRFLATHSAQDRVIAKYREKLESKAKQEGLKDISELKSAYKEKIESLRKEAAVPGVTAPLKPTETAPPTSSSPYPPPPPPPSPTSSPASSPAPSSSEPAPPPGIKTLNSFLDFSKIRSLPSSEIQNLWRLRHASNPSSLHFSLPASTFRTLLAAAKRHPNFVVPLPRQVPAEPSETVSPGTEPQTHQAAELHYLQFGHPHKNTTTLIFTSLLEFQTRGEFATPHTTITFHSELADSHDLVLGQGIVMKERGVGVDEARWLVMCMQKFYVVEGQEASERREMLEMFTRGDGGFKVEKLIEEAEKIL